MKRSCRDSLYPNSGNLALTQMLDRHANTILDIGCGTGANASLIRRDRPTARIYGITISESEARAAAGHFDRIWVCDIEERFPAELSRLCFDTIIFSHVLEHLRDPAGVVTEAIKFLGDGGSVLIAVPNVVNWRQRIRLLLGKFEYEKDGIMDETHLRFFTYYTADRYLRSHAAKLECVEKRADGSVPLWVFRRYILPKRWSAALDRVGVRLWPNLFGTQVLLKWRKGIAPMESDTTPTCQQVNSN